MQEHLPKRQTLLRFVLYLKDIFWNKELLFFNIEILNGKKYNFFIKSTWKL